MSQEREYNGVSLNRVSTLNAALFQDHQRIERNKKKIDEHIYADISRINNPQVVSASEQARSQDASNLEKGRAFSQKYFHELVDIALEDAARAGKNIVDARDFTETDSEEPLVNAFEELYVPGSQELVDLRHAFVEQYCDAHGINPNEVTLKTLEKIRAQPGWQNLANSDR